MAEDQLFYVGQKALIEKDGKFLVLFDPLLGADLPGGKIQAGETDLTAALLREVLEETGLQISVGQPLLTSYFETPKEVNGIPHRNGGKKIYTVVYTAHYLSGELRLSDEHDRFVWMTEDDYQAILKGEEHMTAYKALRIYFSKL